MTGRPRRLFFALWPDEALRAATVAATARAVGEAGGRAVPPENLHVTLAFLGSVPEVRVADAVAAGRTVPVASGVQMFDRVTAWGRRGPLVLEATRLEAPLATLQSSLENALSTAGFALDRRAFRPHITLAREPARRPAPAAPDAAGGSLAWPCTGFVLVDSDTGPGGSKYSVLERFGAS
jgi:2'-5' RNA ligase